MGELGEGLRDRTVCRTEKEGGFRLLGDGVMTSPPTESAQGRNLSSQGKIPFLSLTHSVVLTPHTSCEVIPGEGAVPAEHPFCYCGCLLVSPVILPLSDPC